MIVKTGLSPRRGSPISYCSQGLRPFGKLRAGSGLQSCAASRLVFGGLCMLLLAICLGPAQLLAHDMWIEPANFSPPAGEIIPIRLRVGQDLLGDPLPRDSKLIKQFVVVDSAGSKPVVGRDGSDPAGFVFVAKPGLLVVGYGSNPSAVELTPEKFNQYLKDEGLDAIAALRAQRNTTNASAHELFARCAKSLVLSGSPSEKQADRQLGFTLELVAEKNPYLLYSGEELPVRLTYENRPLAGALVIALNRVNPSERQAVRSDNNGRVRFRLRSGGLWLIKAVHMIPAPADSNAEWASYWASLTFELRNPVAQGN
jgi:uncharacterized GH25 family protein